MSLASEKLSKKRKCKMEDDQPRSGMESIQHDIALDIFSRLPITSLLQFSFVSRFWQMLSYDPHLAALHFSRTAKTNPYLIFHCDYPIRNQLCFAELSDQTDNEIVRRIQTPFHDTMPEFKVIASCNGLLCLSDSLYGDPLYIYNPFTREYKELPKSRQYDDQEVVFGFGFHPVTNEYKVVKIVLFWNQYNMLPHPRPRLRPRHRRLRIDDHTGSEVQVYSLGSTNWRSIGKVPYLLEQRASEAFVDGRLHWLTHPRLYLGARIHRSRSIVSFDLADEQFREVPRPECGSLNRTNYHLAVLGGCLSAVVWYQRFEIWVMEEYSVKESWTKKFNIEDWSRQFWKPGFRRRPYGIWKNVLNQRFARVLCLFENGNILMEYKGGVLVSHDPNSGTYKKLVFQGMPDLFQTFVHFGSLNWIDTPIHTSTN
ncbi:F-box protein [Camellia lanceoleosa]|uniref:F-box protein n=1 Tax=Camellia lanceoleosa TaxID=1840588 RepID=A0ACC0H2X2_9ERIC|nr:F-box protein [Camellia lanceoleosa]